MILSHLTDLFALAQTPEGQLQAGATIVLLGVVTMLWAACWWQRRVGW